MASYIELSSIQGLTVLAVSITFLLAAMQIQKSCKKQYTTLHAWYLFSVLCGVMATMISLFLAIINISAGATSPTTNIEIIWFSAWFTLYAQCSTFITAYILDTMYFFCNNSKSQLSLEINQDIDAKTTMPTVKVFAASIVILFVVAFCIGMLGWGVLFMITSSV
jgi:hypothetical protein